MADVVIQATNLSKELTSSLLRRKVRILSGLNLKVARGETFGLIGPNGAGKTTSIKLMLGLMRPTEGAAEILGMPAGDKKALAQLGYLPENPYFYSHLTGREFLDFAGQLFGIEKKERSERAQELTKLVGLTEAADTQMRKYSKGMLQRLGIAQSLINRPQLIFWDEPMSGLDPIGRKDVRQILFHLKEKGTTIFFNSHLLPDVNEVCDRVGVMNRGQLIVQEDVKNISQGGSYKDLEDFFLEVIAKAEGRCGGALMTGNSGNIDGKQAGPKVFEPVWAIALNTFRETVRDRILYALILFAAIVTVLGIVLGSLSVGQDIRILKDIGLAAISFIGGIIAVFAGTNLVYKEVERRTIYLIFTKPVSGWQFVLGKYIGLCLCVAVMVAAMGAFLIFVITAASGSAGFAEQLRQMGQELALIYLELLFVTALATFFSTFSTPVMSVLFTLAIWLAGHLGDSLIELGKLTQNPVISQFLSVIFYCLPDFAGLTRIRGHLLYGTVPGIEVLTYLVTYVFAYVLMLLVLAAIVTERKEYT